MIVFSIVCVFFFGVSFLLRSFKSFLISYFSEANIRRWRYKNDRRYVRLQCSSDVIFKVNKFIYKNILVGFVLFAKFSF